MIGSVDLTFEEMKTFLQDPQHAKDWVNAMLIQLEHRAKIRLAEPYQRTYYLKASWVLVQLRRLGFKLGKASKEETIKIAQTAVETLRKVT